jgi:hypothetical protein
MKNFLLIICIGILFFSGLNIVGLSEVSDNQISDGGYIIAVETPSLESNNQVCNKIFTTNLNCQGALQEEWNKTFGDAYDDYCYTVQQTNDGGFIVIGETYSFGSGDYDVWLIKTDGNGDEQWNKTYGGIFDDWGGSARQTNDGGYIITGETYSFGSGSGDVWLIKTDGNGDIQWNKTFGGIFEDWCESVQQTNDGGYIVIANTYVRGNYNAWLIKTDGNGDEQWNKTYGGNDHDFCYSVQQTNDNGYIFTGGTFSYSDSDWSNAWLIKTDDNGNEQWNKTYGGDRNDFCNSVQQTNDNGYIVTGETSSYGIGNSYAWLIKTDDNGNEQWNKTFGEKYYDYFGWTVEITNDGGYILTAPSIYLITGNTDLKLIKTDDMGHVEWMKILGGKGFDYGYEVHQTNDGGFVIAGWTDSFGAGNFDGWLVKVSSFNNQRPNKPRVPAGPINGKVGKEFTYISSSTDADGQTTYVIKVKAKDIHNGESDWSDPLHVSISKSKTTNRIFFLTFIRRLTDKISLLDTLLEFRLFKNKSMIWEDL